MGSVINGIKCILSMGVVYPMVLLEFLFCSQKMLLDNEYLFLLLAPCRTFVGPFASGVIGVIGRSQVVMSRSGLCSLFAFASCSSML